ncbi:MAG: hypothetical protein LH629_16380, partial [Ignavibacteria bacterium]|nr:hypothetical protein [Ignavibacteria bacterium]
INHNGNFKIPSLRNVSLTGPYMHDGRFKTLEDVVNFYNDGVQPNEGLSALLTKGGVQGWFDSGGVAIDPFIPVNTVGGSTDRTPLKLNLNDSEKKALVAFLNTLTDYNYISDVACSDPFNNFNQH